MYELIRCAKECLEEKITHLILKTARRSVERKGVFLCGLAGGRTPSGVYSLLREKFELWDRSLFFPTDERYVPTTDPRSNYSFIRKYLGDKANLYRIPTELPIEEACRSFAVALEEQGGLDFLLLGLGEDGHTASIFPGTKCKQCHENACVSRSPDGLLRISMSMEYINSSAMVAFLVTGGSKFKALKSLLSGEPIPASYVKSREVIKVFTDLPL